MNLTLSPSLPSLSHGVQWDKFRAQVQQVMLQRSIGKKYVGPLNEIATDFMERIHEMRDVNNELPHDFLSELYKWALECKYMDGERNRMDTMNLL